MRQQNLVPFPCLYIKLFELVIKVIFSYCTTPPCHRINLFNRPFWGSRSEGLDDASVLLVSLIFFYLQKSLFLSGDRLNSKMYSVRWYLLNYAIWPLIPKTIFIKHCRVEIIAFPFVLFHSNRFFNVCCLFCQQFSAAYLLKLFLLPQRAHTTLFIRCDKPELTRWCLPVCSLHAGIQVSPDEVVGSHDGCRHSITGSIVDVPIRLL